MKNIKTAIIVTVAVILIPFGFIHAADSQTIKIGVVDLPQIVESSPDMKAVNDRLEKQFKPREQTILDAQQEIKKKMEKLERDASVLSEGEANDLEDQIIAERASLQAMQQTFRQDLNLAQTKAYREFLTKVNKAIQEIATKENYTIVFFREGIPYVNTDSEINLTDKVVSVLGNNKG